MSGLGLELREDEIPVPEWKGAPHKWHEYHVRDMFHEMGENPKQHEVMDIERIASVSMWKIPNPMTEFTETLVLRSSDFYSHCSICTKN